MGLTFKKYERAESTYTEIGTVAAQIPGGKLKFTPGTLDKFKSGTNKAISILLIDKKGDSATAPMGKKASSSIVSALDNGASKGDCLAAISKLLMVEAEDGTNIIVAPQGVDDDVEVTVASASKSKVTFSDLVQF